MRRLRLCVVAVALLTAACSSSSTTASRAPTTGAATTGAPRSLPTTTSSPRHGTTTTAAPDVTHARVALQRVVSGLELPVAFAARPHDTAFYVTEQHVARVRVIRDGRLVGTPVLDLHGAVAQGDEQGLLGLTFSPDGTKLYVDVITPGNDTHVDEYAMHGDVADPASKRLVLAVHQPFPNHKGGQLAFGNDGLLYIGLGDGGGAGDPNGNGQNRAVLLGKILRIDPVPLGGHPYSVPADNPFVHTPNAAPEVWMWGLRNPWRFSFDAQTHDLWIGDVGQGDWEEVDHLPAGRGGQNLGWNRREGKHPYNGGSRPAGEVDPVYDYAHTGGRCAIIGGFVYRGHAIADLVGSYLYSDNCDGELDALDAGGQPHDLRITMTAPTSFGQDNTGELYALSADGSVSRLVQAS